jgi:hypothetical protein
MNKGKKIVGQSILSQILSCILLMLSSNPGDNIKAIGIISAFPCEFTWLAFESGREIKQVVNIVN